MDELNSIGVPTARRIVSGEIAGDIELARRIVERDDAYMAKRAERMRDHPEDFFNSSEEWDDIAQ